MSEAWMPIERAPKNGVCVLLKLKDPIPEPAHLDLYRWSGIIFVARHTGFEEAGWQFAAPVGQGGFPDRWIAGWLPLEPHNIIDLRRNLRHWREECGKLQAQISTLKWRAEVQNDQVTISLDHYNALVRDHQKLTALEQAVAAYQDYLKRSVNVGPLTNNPSKEAGLLRKLWDLVPSSKEEIAKGVADLARLTAKGN